MILLLVFFYDYAGIMATKSKSVTQGCPYFALLWFTKCEVQSWIQFRIIGEMINSRGYNIFLHTHYACNGFHYASRTEAVSCHGFSRADIHFESMLAKNINDGFYFSNITKWSRSAMRVDIVNIAGLHARIL